MLEQTVLDKNSKEVRNGNALTRVQIAKATLAALLLGINLKDYIKAAGKQPSLFSYTAEAINANIEETAKYFGIDKETYIEKAAIKKPALFYRSLKEINANIKGAARLLSVTKEEYIEAALKQPTLFVQLPDTIFSHVTETSKLMGIKRTDYIQAALKQPSLFYQSPKTMQKNALVIKDVFEKGYIRSYDIEGDMLRFPASLTYATSNTHLRAIHGHVTEKTWGLSHFFSGKGRDKGTIEKEVVDHYRTLFNEKGKGAITVQRLAAAGIISRVPDWAQPSLH